MSHDHSPPTVTQAAKTATGRTGITAALGAMFLMATSAIGPGFITQTTVFTAKMGAAFAFAIVVSILVDIAIQLNVWRVIGVSGLRANELGNTVLPGLGWVMAFFVFVGGMVFNIGNIGGTGLGLNAMLGLDARIGGAISAAIAIGILVSEKAGIALDRIVVALGGLMIAMMLYVSFISHPPVGEALKNSVFPQGVPAGQMATVITTLIGGTVGGYITFAGAHRLIEAKVTGSARIKEINRSSVMGILVTCVMRVLLFLAILGVVAGGVALSGNNIAADAFRSAAGDIGVRLFGVILWAAGLTSVIGASYTSISFVTKQTTSHKTRNYATIAFIIVCALAYVLLNKAPQKLLIFAGAVNGLILPIGFAVVLWVAWRRRDLLENHVYPRALLIIGTSAWLLTIYLGIKSLSGIVRLWS